MQRRTCWTAIVGGCALLVLLARPAEALITRPTPLQDLLSGSTWIVTAKVEMLDETRPAMMLAIDETLQGKPPGKKMPVLLQGDKRAEKLKESPELLKRLAVKLPVVVFGNKRGEVYSAIVYSNGTWFSLAGTLVDGEVRWSFTHLELYLRRTYTGTTAEMTQTLRDAISGKRKPPPENTKEKPGVGPEVKPAKKSAALGGAGLGAVGAGLRAGPVGALGLSRAATEGGPYSAPPRRAVIPTVLVGGPLAMLALLFPAVFGGWRRWFGLLSTAGTISTLYFCQWWFADSLTGWWSSLAALWTLITVTAVLGLGWAWSRHLFRVQTGEAPLLAGGIELVVLGIVSLMGLATIGVCRHFQQSLLAPDWLPVLAFILAIWSGTAYVAWTWLRGPRLIPALATETVVLTALAVACVALTPALPARSTAGGLEAGEQTSGEKVSAELVWTFRLPERGSIASSPLVVGDKVFVAAAHDDVFRPWGALYCLDRNTGKVLWTFHDGKKMKQVFSSPVVAGNRLYIGEGFHQDFDCKLYCLEIGKGRKQWEFQTGSHTEATPALSSDGKVYIGSGDDGLYCIDARTGDKRWNFPGFHIDAGAVLDGERLFVGCGIGDVYKTTALFCLDVDKGQPKWRIHTDLPVWSRPIVSGGFVYAGSGNGRLNESDDNPAGCVYCVRAADGNEVWKRKMPDGVLGRLGADRQRLYFGCRDGSFSCLSRRDGSLVWRRDLGSAVVAGAALDVGPGLESLASRLYASSIGGQLVCLEAATGKQVWSKDLVEYARVPVEVISTPALELGYDEKGREVRRVYVGVTLTGAARFGELHCYEEKGE